MLLEQLSITYNAFSQLPPVIFKLGELKELNLYSSGSLTRIDEGILHLTNLETLNCNDCVFLEYPPYVVCKQGYVAVKNYITDLKADKGGSDIVVPVSIIGNSMAGKSSLVRSLQRGTRCLTHRSKYSPLDEATKVFRFEDLRLPNSTVRFWDHGGQDIYHIVYQMALRDNYIPLIVVNLKQFYVLSQSRGSKEAAKQVCFNWLCHLYLACPQLGSLILVLTHADKIACVHSQKQLLLSAIEAIRSEIFAGERRCDELQKTLAIQHLSNKQQPIFRPEDIFVFSNDLTETSNIEALKANLDCRCRQRFMMLPQLWERVGEFIENQTDKPYLKISDVKAKFADSDCDCEIILRFFHNLGKIFRFEREEKLSEYIFHQFSVITEMIAVLFHHHSADLWKSRVSSFSSFTHNQITIGTQRYEYLVEQFLETGVIDEVLLAHLLVTESRLPFDVAISLLQSFYILHGPIYQNLDKSYILPYFANRYMGTSWETDGDVQLRLSLVFGGLGLPKYAFQLMTVAVLNHASDPNSVITVAKNGATVRCQGYSTHFVHDHNTNKVTLQIATTLSLLAKSWKNLLETSKSVLNVTNTWKACHAEVVIYCAHCLFLRDPNPAYEVDPSWLHTIYQNKSEENASLTTYGSQLVSCRRCATNIRDLRPTVPKPFRIPCELFFFSFFIFMYILIFDNVFPCRMILIL